MRLLLDRDNERLREAICLDLWKRTYRQADDDAAAGKAVDQMLKENFAGDDPDRRLRDWVGFMFGTKWLHCGRTQLVAGQKYAAAMMCSAAAGDLAGDIIVPWKAFAVDVPPGLLAFDGLAFHAITVGLFDFAHGTHAPDGPAHFLTLWGSRGGGDTDVQFSRFATTSAELLFPDEDLGTVIGEELRDLDVKARALRLAVRLVTGLLYTLQYTDNFKAKAFTGKARSSSREGPPPHRVYVVGRPLGVDCRPAVARFMGGKGAIPSVQSLVRGHYKRQVIGVGRTGRKVVWIEPYWRGPEDAPILARPYKVGPKEDP